MKNKLINLVLDHPKKCMGAAFLVVLLSCLGLFKFEERYGATSWYKESDPLLKQLRKFEKQFGNDASVVLGVHAKNGLFTKDSMTALKDITDKLWTVKEVIRVESIVNYRHIEGASGDIEVSSFIPEDAELTEKFLSERKELALKHEVLQNYLINKEGNFALVFGRLAPPLNGRNDYHQIIADVRKMLSAYKDNKNLEFKVLGEAAVNNAFKEVSREDLKRIVPILFLIIVFFLFYQFRSVLGVVIPFVIFGTSFASCLGIGFLVGVKYNNFLSSLPAVLIAIAIADSVHLLMSFSQARSLGLSQLESARKSLEKNLLPTLITTVSTVFGFIGLSFSEMVPVKEFGILCAIGTLFAWLMTIFVLGPLLAISPSVASFKVKKKEKKKLAIAPWANKWVNFISSRPLTVMIIFTAISIGALVKGLDNEVNANIIHYFKKDVKLRKDGEFIIDNLGGTAGPELVIDSGMADGVKDPEFLRKTEEYQNWISNLPEVSKVISVVDIIKQMNRAFHKGDQKYYAIANSKKRNAELLFLYTMSLPQGMDLKNRMNLDGSQIRLSVLSTSTESKVMVALIDKIIAKGKTMGLNLYATGKFNLWQRVNSHVVSTFTESIITAFLLVSILMIIIFRSLSVGFLSMIPNVIPLVFGLALMSILDKTISIGTTLVTSVCLGIAVDDTVHFMTHYFEALKKGLSREDAFKSIFTSTGPALILTTLILVSSFGLLYLANFVPNQDFGILCALILVVALITDMVFLPAFLIYFNNEPKTAKASKRRFKLSHFVKTLISKIS